MAYYRHAFLLDDDPAALFLLEDALEEAQIARQVYCFTRFSELLPAFERLAEGAEKEDNLPDVLLLDLHMPGRDGLEVLEDILQIPGIGGSKVCVFLISTSYNPSTEAAIKQYPVSGYFTKPLQEQAISTLIQSARRNECELKELNASSSRSAFCCPF
jgi:two-component system response regulator